jgi:putative ABC transport system permease protein
MAFKSIRGNKGRSILTMLGIIIGIASVMTIVSVINGSNQQTLKQFEAMGTNKVNVSASPLRRGAFSTISTTTATPWAATWCWASRPAPSSPPPWSTAPKTAPSWRKTRSGGMGGMGGGTAASRKQRQQQQPDMPPQLYFGSDQYAVCNNFQVAKGRDITQLDINRTTPVCVLGARAAKIFFNYADPVGQTMQVNGLPYTVIGVYAEKDPDSQWSLDNIIVFPYTASRYLAP